MKRYVTTIPESSTKRPAYERDNLVNDLRNEIQKHQDNLRNHLAELFFLHNDGNLLDINLWTNQSNPFLENYIQQIKCASTDALPDLLEQVPTGHVMPKVEVKKEEHSSTPFMSSMAALSEGGVIEKAKHEALIVQQVAVLKQQGMWSLKRLPKVKEPDKIKCHWDYLLEEMQWLATDFSQERKWKKAAAKKQAYAVAKVFEEKEAAKRRQMVEQEKKLKKIAHNIAKDVMKMWSGVEKVHKFKQESHLEERRRKLMDTHLNIIVGQTEQFSSWLAQGLTKTPKSSVMLTPSSQDGDVEFKPATLDQPDDEETIAAAEEEGQSDVEEELADLKKQNEMDLNELIQTLPPGMLEKTGEGSSHSTDYNASDDTSADDEDTIAKAEADDDKGSDKADEIGDLQHDQDVPLEELIARYVKKRDAMTESSGTGSGVSEEDSEEEEESEASDGEDADMELSTPSSAKEIDIELGKLCSGASEVEPSNKTSPSKSKLPFLLRGQLREYQEVGLQWLVAMEARKLNGILADEMGLGKTMQTIALLAHLACFKGIWGPHLIIVPTSVLLNWDLEFKKWLPSFKVMSYYGSQKERREKRVGWTKPNTFHVCVTSYKLVIQDYRAFRSKKWYFLILDEAHNIKNFKSQRWQLLLNFNSQRRLLLTGTPLQNNLMELWSLMHFLMPSVFGSQSAFREWFGNPLVGMVEGTEEYNAHLVERLHKILRPFLLRRLKKEVELQLPTKTESVLMCGLSKRQRALYEEFLSRKDTRDTLSSGRFISVIGILMQLRKVCNHPDLFEERGVFSPLALPSLQTNTPALLLNALRSNNHIDLDFFNFNLVDYEHSLSAHSAHRTQQIKAHRLLIEEVNYKGAVPDNVLYTAPSHSSFPPPRPPSPTLPPLPLLRQMPSLAPPRSTPPTSARSTPGAPTSSARSNPKSSPRPMSSPRSLPSPRSVHYTSPNPLSLSSPRSDSSEPPPLMAKQVTRNPETRETPVGSVSPQSPASSNLIPAGYFRDPVSGVMLPLVEPGMPPPRRPPLGPPQLTNYTSKGSSKRGAMLPPTLAHSSCSSPEPHALRTMSPRNTVETSPVKAERRSPDHADGCCNNSLALPSLEETRQAWRTSRRRMLADLNDMRCQRVPMYGADLISTVSVKFSSVQHKTVIERMEDLSPIIERFMICCDPISVSVNPISLKHMATSLIDQCHDLTDLYHPVRSKLQMIMPETRLIQYDCGKLQRLDRLLADLKVGDHRALIFTQMTKVLDILERFLNYHGYRYLRLDGTTRVDHRLELMERFNADSKIFCMILSTRSGGVGVNLTGADTVIFYDSDWNPTMDAQAQDRCHRIGQTRDVHIYRLISSCTIEENILKKANQKRLLGAVAIEEGNFTTAFFKKDNMAELFGNTIVEEDPSTASPKHRTISKKDLEQVLADAEDVEDRSAAQRATTEQSQDMCDFDEEVAIEGEPAMSEADKDIVAENKEFKQFEDEIKSIEDELTPLEQFALRFLEAENAENFSELLKQQEEELTVPDTSLHAMQAAQEEQGYQDDLLLTYSMWDPQVILLKCKRKRRLAARQRREEELPSSSEHSSDEEYVRPVYEKKRQNRYCLAKIEAEKERLYLELAKCKKKLASAQRKCSAQAAKLTRPAARPGPSVVPRMPFPGRALIPVLTQARPMISIYNPGNPCRPPVCYQSSSAGSTPRLTVKGPKRTYASKRNPLPPNTHPDSLPTSSSWTSQTPIAHSVGQDHLLCQNNILRRQRNLTINPNIPDTFTADSNLPKFFPTSMSYATNMNYSVPYVPNNIQPPPVSSIYQQFNMAGLGHSYNPRAQPVSPAYFNSSPYNKAAYQPVVNPHNPYQYGNVDLNPGWNNSYQTNGVHYNQGQVPQTLTVSSAPTIRHHIPSSTFAQIPNSQFQPGSGCHSNLQNVGFSAAVTPAFPPPSYESHVNQAAISFPSEVEIMSPSSGVLNPDPSSYNGQPASSGIS